MYRQCAAHAFTISGICGAFAVALIGIGQNYFQLLLRLIVSIHLLLQGMHGMVDTKLQRVQNRLTRIVTKSPPFTSSVPLLCSLHCLPVKFRVLFKISFLTYKTLHEKQPVYLHSMLAAPLPSRSLRSSKGISLSVRTNTGAGAFHSCAPPLSGATCCCLSLQSVQFLCATNIWRHVCLTWPFPS